MSKINKSVSRTRYIFVTGGVISGVGKGIMAASIGAVLKAKGLKVSVQKCDQYFNVDAGLLNPREHGECFVTRDGAETDLDLGHYERFLDEELTCDSIWTSGKIYKKLIDNERAGKFGGSTVQLVPHVTDLVQQTFLDNAEKFGSDVHIVEVGGSVGDLEGAYYIEAIREFASKVGRGNCFYVHVVFVPYLSTSCEYKTKPAQNALRDLRESGIIPDMVAARVDEADVYAPVIAQKLATFCGISEDAVVVMPNAASVYEVPLNLVQAGGLKPLDRYVDHGDPDMSVWQNLVKKMRAEPKKEVTVGLIAKYIDNADTYISVTEALKAAAWAENVKLSVKWIDADKLEVGALAKVDGILVPGGFGARGLGGKVAAATYALENGKPYLGLCLGLQVAVIAAARLGGLSHANTEEVDPGNSENVVCTMAGQKGKESTGGTMRLGDYTAKLAAGSLAAKLYGTTDVVERHRHRYEVNQKFLPSVEKGGVVVSGTSPDGELVEFVEATNHKFFVATQAHPEFRSRPMRPHPLFVGFIKSLK
jgi:CTP synthase